MNIEAIKKANQLLEIKEELEIVKNNYERDNKVQFKFLTKNLKVEAIKWIFQNKEMEYVAETINVKARDFIINEINIKIQEIDNQIKQIE